MTRLDRTDQCPGGSVTTAFGDIDVLGARGGRGGYGAGEITGCVRIVGEAGVLGFKFAERVVGFGGG